MYTDAWYDVIFDMPYSGTGALEDHTDTFLFAHVRILYLNEGVYEGDKHTEF